MNIPINRDIFDGKWMQIQGVVKQRWGDLTDNDLQKVQGRYDQFVGLLQEKYGHSRKTAEEEVARRLNDLHDLTNRFPNSTTTPLNNDTNRKLKWLGSGMAVLAAVFVGILLSKNNNADKS